MATHLDAPGKGPPLLLAAAELVGPLQPVLVNAGHSHGLIHPAADFFRRHPKVFQGKGHILFHHRGHNLIVRVLEHHAHGLADVVELAVVLGVHSFHQHGAAFRQEDRVEMLGKGGFAAAVCPQHRHKFAFFHGHAGSVHGPDILLVIVAEPHLIGADHRGIFHGVSSHLSRAALPGAPRRALCSHSAGSPSLPGSSVQASSQMAVAPQGTTPPVALTGRPISSQWVTPPYTGPSVVLRMYSITAGERPVV